MSEPGSEVLRPTVTRADGEPAKLLKRRIELLDGATAVSGITRHTTSRNSGR